MGILDQFKMASDMMKNMTPEQMQQLLKPAEESKHMLEDAVRKTLDEEIRKRELLTRKEAEEMIRKALA